MTSRIKGSDASAIDSGANRTVERLRRSTPSSSTATPAKSPADKANASISIADTTHRLAALQELVAAMPQIDAGRVAALSHAIEQGQYAADPRRIADRLLQLERDLAAAGQRKT